MKQILFFLFFCLTTLVTKAQTEAAENIQLNSILTEYTVSAGNDTTFAREIVMDILDTVSFQSIDITISIKTENGWQTQQSVNLTKPSVATKNCTQALCLYRRNSIRWVLYLGPYSLFSTHLVELQFNSTGNTLNWTNEF